MTRAIVTCSRHGVPDTLIRAALEALPVGHLIHGDAPGVDRQAAEIAASLGWTVEPFPADWSRGPKAGPERNQRMVEAGADVCIAFPRAGSKGTWDCVRRAQAAQIRTLIYTSEI